MSCRTFDPTAGHFDPDGNKRWFATQVGAMRVDGRLIGIAQVSQHSTELKPAREEFASAQRLATVRTLAERAPGRDRLSRTAS